MSVRANTNGCVVQTFLRCPKKNRDINEFTRINAIYKTEQTLQMFVQLLGKLVKSLSVSHQWMYRLGMVLSSLLSLKIWLRDAYLRSLFKNYFELCKK